MSSITPAQLTEALRALLGQGAATEPEFERAIVVDRLRRSARESVRLCMQDAGLWQGATAGRRSYRRARHALQVSAALLQLSPDLDARQINANALLASRCYRAAAREFTAIEDLAPGRLYRDAARVGRSIAMSFQHEGRSAFELCERAARSPFRIVALNASLTMVVQAGRGAASAEVKKGLERCALHLDDAMTDTVARLLSNYAAGSAPSRRRQLDQTLRAAGQRGTAVANQLQGVMEACETA